MPGFFFSLKQGFRGKDSGMRIPGIRFPGNKDSGMRIPGIKIPGKGFGG
jgi:hypothetical protein